MRSAGRRITWMVPWAFALIFIPRPARAFEFSGGVNLGGMLVGTVPRLMVSPHAGISWRTEGGFLFALRGLIGILPPINGRGAGIDNQISVAIGYASEKINFSAGPSLSVYYMPVCDAALCGRVIGLSPGGHLQADMYFAGPLGVSASANVVWTGGTSLVLHGGVAATVIAGPILRWSSK